MEKLSISLVGPGSLATALATWLHTAGYRLDEVIARKSSLARARSLARRVDAQAVRLERATLSADVVWICVPDDAIAACARALAPRVFWKGKIAFHSSGALGSDQLDVLRECGAAAASVHPMMTFVRGAQPPAPRGIPFAAEGDAAALRLARRLVRDLGAEFLIINRKHKPLYHALGAFASPLIVAELALAERIARAAGIPPAAARRTIAPILRRTLENYVAGGAAAAFSGPILRGDLGTIRKHLQALRAVSGAHAAYVALARAALREFPVRNRKGLERILRLA